MSDTGPWRIIGTVVGESYCDECYRDLMPDTRPDDLRFAISSRAADGTCQCCGGEVVAGEMLDYEHPLL